ncbi:MAG: GNAT family N-acetyltransferase, partial [Dehalococcoidia bacterium]
MDDRRRLAGICGVTITAAHNGQAVYIGSEVSDILAPAVVDAVERSPLAPTPDREPPALGTCRRILASCCPRLTLDAGPAYLIEPRVPFATRPDIVRSDTSSSESLRRLNPGNWEHDEWNDLLDGALGPWAMAVAGGKVVSLCHTPLPMTESAAECGVWTHPDARGQGYAAAVTATWADILRPSGRLLFYGTDVQNHSSQRVAARLRLRLIGWTWSLIAIDPTQRSQRHPLSRPAS